jgi:hypothetical protein
MARHVWTEEELRIAGDERLLSIRGPNVDLKGKTLVSGRRRRQYPRNGSKRALVEPNATEGTNVVVMPREQIPHSYG